MVNECGITFSIKLASRSNNGRAALDDGCCLGPRPVALVFRDARAFHHRSAQGVLAFFRFFSSHSTPLRMSL